MVCNIKHERLGTNYDIVIKIISLFTTEKLRLCSFLFDKYSLQLIMCPFPISGDLMNHKLAGNANFRNSIIPPLIKADASL